MKSRIALIASLAALLATLACLAVWPTFQDPVTWTPDALFYQARVLEIRGADHDAAISRTFEGSISAELRGRDPQHTGNAAWVEYNEPFYERRVALPLAGAAVYPLAGERSLLYLSLAGYVATILALFGLLLLRFRLAIASIVTLATIFLPPLTNHSSYPLTDSWGLALEIVALECGNPRARPWSSLAPALDRRDRRARLHARQHVDSRCSQSAGARSATARASPVTLFGTGIAAALPAVLLFKTPVRELLALLVNGSEPSADTSWTFIVSHYPGALLDLVRANVGFLRRGEWYTALYVVGGVLSLLHRCLAATPEQPGHDVDDRGCSAGTRSTFLQRRSSARSASSSRWCRWLPTGWRSPRSRSLPASTRDAGRSNELRCVSLMGHAVFEAISRLDTWLGAA